MKTSKNRKKTISCVLATAMTAGLFTGCGTVAEDTSQPEATDETPVTEAVMPDYDFTVSYDGLASCLIRHRVRQLARQGMGSLKSLEDTLSLIREQISARILQIPVFSI